MRIRISRLVLSKSSMNGWNYKGLDLPESLMCNRNCRLYQLRLELFVTHRNVSAVRARRVRRSAHGVEPFSTMKFLDKFYLSLSFVNQ